VPTKDAEKGEKPQILKLEPGEAWIGKSAIQTRTYQKPVPMQDIGAGKNQAPAKPEDKPKHLFKKIIAIPKDIEYTPYLMPLYMHVKFHISFFVLPESAFKEEEVVERYTDVYIYLKPYFITDKEILKVLDFADNIVPKCIPMPPH
jgi:hypothetical protein